MDNDIRCLVKTITGFEEDNENFQLCVQYVTSNFKYHRYLDVNSNKIQKSIQGLCDKFIIYCQDKKAKTFKTLVHSLIEDSARTEYGKELSYALLSLLLNLSDSPTYNELTYEEHGRSISENSDSVDWGKYLLEGELDHSLISYHEYSEDSESVDDNEELVIPMTTATTPSERDDSGIEITGSSDSKSGNSQCPSVTPTLSESSGQTWFQDNTVTPYWNKQSEITSPVPPSKAHTANVLKQWEEHLDTFQFSGNSDYITLSERIVIKEVLWMLQGVQDLSLFAWKDGSFEVKPAQTSHITDLALHNFLSKLCHYGSSVKHLQQFIKVSGKSDFQSAVCCQTYQAFADSINKSLHSYFEKISQFEKQLIDQEETLTLLQLTDQLKPYFDDIKIIFSMYKDGVVTSPSDSPAWSRAVQLLSVQYKHLSYHTTWTSNRRIFSLVFSIFLRTFCPYLKLLDDLISHGCLNDPWQEFVIERRPVNIADEHFWESALVMHPIPRDIASSFILEPLLSQIILGGKSMEMLRHLGSTGSWSKIEHNGSLYLEFLIMLHNMLNGNISQNRVITETVTLAADEKPEETTFEKEENADEGFSDWLTEIINNNSLLHYNFSKMIEHSKIKSSESPFKQWEHLVLSSDTGHYPVAVCVRIAMCMCVEQRCNAVSKMLINTLNEKYDLLGHMEAVRKFFLMEVGDVSFSFYSDIFDKLCNGESWQDISFVTTALQDALLWLGHGFDQRLTVALEANCSSNKNNKLNELNSLHFSYKVSWPVNVVLTFSSLQKYHEIFVFLLQIKCAKYALDELRFEELNPMAEDKLQLLLLGKERELPVAQKFHSICLLRMRLLHFINSFHTYIMTQIQDHTGLTLKKELETALTLEQILHSHSRYLAQLYDCTLLHSEFSILKDAVCLVLNLALSLQHCWKSGINNVDTDKLFQIEKNFTQCIHFLHSRLKMATRNRVVAHLKVLSYGLNSQVSLLPVIQK